MVEQGLDGGYAVTAVTRRPADFGLSATRLRVIGGDVTDPAQVEAAITGADAVISVVGVNPSRKPIDTYSAGMQNMIRAMQVQGVRRIVGVSSKNLTEEGTRGEPWLFRLVFAPALKAVSRTLYEDMRRMESILSNCDRDWTIVRPAGLFATSQISAYRCTTGHEPGVFTSTADLADVLIKEASDDSPHVGSVLEVLTDAGTPTLPALIARQASMHRR